MRNVDLSTLCLVLISACVDFHKVKRGLPIKKFIAIKGGGRPTRLLPYANNAAYSNKVVFDPSGGYLCSSSKLNRQNGCNVLATTKYN